MFIGLVLAIYHVLIQAYPSLDIVQFCGQGPSCSAEQTLGPAGLSIPMLSLVAFAAISVLILWSQEKASEES